jgi:hypothetical protein
MFQPVLLHHYDDLEPHDHSGNGNLGYGASRLGPGSAPGRRAVNFDGANDRIYVMPSPTLTAPGDIRVDVTARMEAFEHRRTLVEGYLSFAFVVERDGALSGGVYRASEWPGVTTAAGLVPLNRWFTATFVGSASAQILYLDGEQVAESYRDLGPASGVAWPFGLSIGAWPDGDKRVFKGSIEQVTVWRSVDAYTRTSGV